MRVETTLEIPALHKGRLNIVELKVVEKGKRGGHE